MNQFISGIMSSKGSARTENGAISYMSTGKELVDQFGKAASFRGRDVSCVFDDQARLWKENADAALKFPFYLRMITREVKMSEEKRTEKVQRGAGVRDEAFKRLLWIAYNHKDEFYRNLWVLPVVGAWKDMWTMLVLDKENGSKLNHEYFYAVMAAGLDDSTQCDLIRKYMPAIRSAEKCKTDRAKALNTLAKEFAAFLGLSAKEYRKMKASGTAHDFQKLMCAREYADIDFKTIPGKALLNIVGGKFLNNHGLYKKYVEWIKSQPVAKFNGYPYELGAKLLEKSRGWYYRAEDIDLATRITIDKQFDNLVETGKKNNGAIKGNVWCALDTSGSMSSIIPGSNVTALQVCVSLGLYFSTLNEGAFHKNVIMFDNTSRVKQLSGSFSEMWSQVPHDAMGGTNFQSVVDEIVRIRKAKPEIPLADYPQTLLVVSDMQFNPSGSYWYSRKGTDEMSNIEAAKTKLRTVFPDEFVDNFKFIWWDVTSRETSDVPSTLDDNSSYFFSGFDGSIVSFLLGGDGFVDKETGEKRIPTAEEVIDIALNQEVMQMVR